MSIIKNKNMLLHLSLIPGCGEKLISYITQNYTFLENFYTFSEKNFIDLGCSASKAKLIWNGLRNKKIIEDELMRIEKNNIFLTTPLDSQYPKNLLSLETQPPVLYTKAKEIINWNDRLWLAMVSSRKTNTYGKEAILQFISALKNYPIGIISGGALGGDRYIHDYAIENKLPTIAVLGCGLEYIYPLQNEKLFDTITNTGGALVSHFCMSQQATKYTFPIRNAIIVGLADALIVVQAGTNSGTLITAQYGLDFGRPIGAIPGSIFDPLSFGANELIRNGAECLNSPEQIFEILGIKKNDISSTFNYAPMIASEPREYDNLNTSIINYCLTPKHTVEIALHCTESIETIQEKLYDLMLDNKIKQDALGNWIKV